MRTLLRTSIVLLALHEGGAAALAEEVRSENKLIADAGFILKRTYLTTNSDLQILSPSAAVLTGKLEGPVLIGQTDQCTLEIKARGAYGYRIDFRLMTDAYNMTCSATGCDINVVGNGPVGCLTGTQGKDQCRSYLSLRYYGREDGQQVLATLNTLHRQCSATRQ